MHKNRIWHKKLKLLFNMNKKAIFNDMHNYDMHSYGAV